MKALRTDRLLTLYLFHPLTRLAGYEKKQLIPILMYHSISEQLEKGVHPYYQTVTTPLTFAKQMRFLSDNKYRTIELNDLRAYHKYGDHAHDKAVVLTFDDGFRDFYTEALPLLKQYDFCATMFLATDFIGTASKRFKGRDCLSWAEVRECQAAGVTFGSHTASHPLLSTLTPDAVAFEWVTSKDMIEEMTGTRVESFSYPYAFPETRDNFVRNLYRILQEADYSIGVTSTIGTAAGNDNRYFLKRLPVNDHDDLRLFKAKLEGGYNWLRTVQYARKIIAQRISSLSLTSPAAIAAREELKST